MTCEESQKLRVAFGLTDESLTVNEARLAVLLGAGLVMAEAEPGGKQWTVAEAYLKGAQIGLKTSSVDWMAGKLPELLVSGAARQAANRISEQANGGSS